MLQLRNSFFSSLICYEYFVLFNYLCGERFRLQLQMKTVNSFSSNSVTSLRRMDYVLKRKKFIHVCGISTEIRSNSMWPLPPRKKRELQSISIGMFFCGSSSRFMLCANVMTIPSFRNRARKIQQYSNCPLVQPINALNCYPEAFI